MSPEFGATAATFPVDDETLRYLRDTGRPAEQVDAGRALHEGAGPLPHRRRGPSRSTPRRSTSTSTPSSRAWPGPRRPQDRVSLPQVRPELRGRLRRGPKRRRPRRRLGRHLGDHVVHEHVQPGADGRRRPRRPKGGRARAQRRPWVKTSLAPGSRVVIGYLERAGLMEPLEQLGFNLVGFGCTTCIGNSGPLPDEVAAAIDARRPEGGGGALGQPQLRGPHPPGRARQLSGLAAARRRLRAGGHREHRPHHRAARARAADGPVYLRDVWPSRRRGRARRSRRLVHARPLRRASTAASSRATSAGAACPCPRASSSPGIPRSTYVREATFFEHDADLSDIVDARVLALLGDSVTTDHISPAGAFAPGTPAGRYLDRARRRAARLQLATAPAAATTR